jgi:N-methylhydantoinase A
MLSSIQPSEAASRVRFCSGEDSASHAVIPFKSASPGIQFENAADGWSCRASTIRERINLRVAIDTGGTFTDCVYFADGELRVLKLFSTPGDPSLAVLDALQQIGAGSGVDVRHGTTIGTNAMLERKGARVAFVTTAGFEDTIAIGRQTRDKLYDWFAPIPVCLVPKELRFGVRERVSAEGERIESPSDEELDALVREVRASGAEAAGVSLLFSFANPETELRVEAALQRLGIPVSTSHRILPEFREYERAAAIVVNAYLAPRMEHYLLNLQRSVVAHHTRARVDVMQSSGGLISANLAAREPVRTVLSGPAGGVIGACQVARWAGFDRILGLDMGGTSTDVFLADVMQGARLTTESTIAGVPLAVPMLDIHTVGAGGGSLARFDAGGMLRVGPESAGSEPGPICFGRGSIATVTDANLLLGRLDADSFLGGRVRLDRQRTEQMLSEQKGSLGTVEEFAAGILRVVETQMEKAIRVISVERGQDPRQFTLVAFGGGGPLHACSLARALRIPRVLIPAMPGALSAMGILLADFVRDYSRTVMLPGEAIAKVDAIFEELEERGSAEFRSEDLVGFATRTMDLRYQRQGYELNVAYGAGAPADCVAEFHRLHHERYGFSDVARPVEIVNLRLRMTAAADEHTPARHAIVAGDGADAFYAERQVYFDGMFVSARMYRRDLLRSGDVLTGPAMITEYSSATVLPPESRASVDVLGNILITFAGESA